MSHASGKPSTYKREVVFEFLKTIVMVLFIEQLEAHILELTLLD
jgi:hypothetical protein